MSSERRSVRTADLDVAVDVFTQAFTGGSLEVSDFDGFYYRQDSVADDAVAVVQQAMGARVRSSSQESPTLFLAWTDRGRTAYRMGGVELDAEDGLLWSGREAVQVDVERAEVGSISIERSAFETRSRRLLGDERFLLPDFAALPAREHVDLMRAHSRALRSTYLQERVAVHPLAQSAVADLTVSMMLAAIGLDDTTVRGSHAPLNVRRAIAFIDENLHRPISLSDIAGASGLSARGLTAAFRRATDETPMQRLRRARLDRVRADLLAADPSSATVGAIAVRWGFVHLGRFAAVYQDRFGELPGRTLRR